MVLNWQLECGFSKGSPSLINTLFYLLDGPLAGMLVTVTDWKHVYIFFFKRQNWKITFYQHFETLNASPHLGWNYSIRQSTVRMPSRAYFFPDKKRIYIRDPPSHHKKGSLPHNFHSLAIFQGIWRFWVYECTCLKISHYFLCTLQVWVLLLAFPIR